MEIEIFDRFLMTLRAMICLSSEHAENVLKKGCSRYVYFVVSIHKPDTLSHIFVA